ncbi:hypothetical protein NYE54_08400 [Paenibacillus sp. FSL K6-1330]|uniref:hypothetical protein n=1 Tax=Paenibacillus sp. FSL K6-1330 TaxID=2975292 RepID=UPI0030D7C706
MKLSEDAIKHLTNLEMETYIDDIFQIDAFHKNSHISGYIPISGNPERLLGQNVLQYLQMALYRSYLLSCGFIDSVNNNNQLTGAINVRAHFEMTGAIAHLIRKMMSYYSNSITYSELHDVIVRLSLGIKGQERKTFGAPEPINVMSMIDAADKLFGKLNGVKETRFRASYDKLSEYCHPNSFGLQISCDFSEVGVAKFKPLTDNPYDIDLYFLSSFMVTSTAFKLFYQSARETIEKNEVLPMQFS